MPDGVDRLSGAVVAEDPWTGGILALASYPNYNPSDFAGDRWKRVTFDLTDSSQPLFDRAIAAATPGTGFKAFKNGNGIRSVDRRRSESRSVIDDTGGWDCGGYYAATSRPAASEIRPSFQRSRLRATVTSPGVVVGQRALAQVRVGFRTRRKERRSDLPGENEGNWPTNAWELRAFGVPMEPSDACFLGIGQGAMQATPLQIANVASAVINGGTLYRPQVVREVRDPSGGLVVRFTPRVIRQVPVTASALAAVRNGMAKVTDPGGTAYGLAIDGLPYSGKTGTVETAGGNGPQHDVVRRVGANGSPAFGAGRVRRSQRRLRCHGRGTDRASDFG